MNSHFSEQYQCNRGHVFSASRPTSACPDCGSRQVRPVGGGGHAVHLDYRTEDRPVISSGFRICYTIFYWLVVTLMIIAAVLLVLLPPAGMVVAFVTPLFSIAAAVLFYIALFRAWKSIQPLRLHDESENRMPTAGAAVGYLFIPFFNLYWIFVALAGLARRMNKYASCCGQGVKVVSEGMAVSICVFTLLLPPLQVGAFLLSLPTVQVPVLALALGIASAIVDLVCVVFIYIYFLQITRATNYFAAQSSAIGPLVGYRTATQPSFGRIW